MLRRVADSRSVFRRWVQRRFHLVGDSSTGPRPYPGGVGASRCNRPVEESFQSPVRERLVDVAIAVALAALAVSEALTDDPSVAYVFPEPNGWLVLLTLLGSLPLAFRRVRRLQCSPRCSLQLSRSRHCDGTRARFPLVSALRSTPSLRGPLAASRFLAW